MCLYKGCAVTCQVDTEGRQRLIVPQLNLTTRRVLIVNAMPRLLYTCEGDPVPIVQKGGWALSSVLMGLEKLPPTGIGAQDHPVCNKSLYQLCFSDKKCAIFGCFCFMLWQYFVSLYLRSFWVRSFVWILIGLSMVMVLMAHEVQVKCRHNRDVCLVGVLFSLSHNK